MAGIRFLFVLRAVTWIGLFFVFGLSDFIAVNSRVDLQSEFWRGIEIDIVIVVWTDDVYDEGLDVTFSRFVCADWLFSRSDDI